MTYFVTGATGFIGRHLVERLLERDGDIYVLVREGSTDKLERLLGAVRRGRSGSSRCSATSPQPQLGLDDAAREQLAGRRPLLPPRRDLRHHRRRDAATRSLNVGGTQNAIDLANALGAKRFHHMSSIAVAGSYDGWFTEDDFDEGQEFPSPYHRTKFESEKLVRERVAGAVARVPPVARRRQLQDRRDGQDRRAVLLLQGDPEAPARAAGVVPADLARVRAHQPRAGRLRRRRGRPHRPPGRARRPGVPHRRPEAAALRRRAEHVRQRRARPARGHARRQADDRHAPEGRARRTR